MKALTPITASQLYPDAWSNILLQMDDLRRDSGADIIALSISVVNVGGVPTLELITLTDLGPADDEDVISSPLRFHAAIAERPALRVVR